MKRKLLPLMLCILASSVIFAQPDLKQAFSFWEHKPDLNITSFGTLRTWNNQTGVLGTPTSYKVFNSQISDSSNIGLFWWEARDIQRIAVLYENKLNSDFSSAIIQYWHYTWPESPPKMPTKEDLEDDPFRGKWITAATEVKLKENLALYTFKPLSEQENANAQYLPGLINYRRTLKVRLIFPQQPLRIKNINVFSTSKEKENSLRIELINNNKNKVAYEGSIEVFNGRLKNIKGWKWDKSDKKTSNNSWKMQLNKSSKGIITEIVSAEETLPGSNDETIVTLHSTAGNFSFSVNDLMKGPIFIPHFNAYITRSDDPIPFSKTNPVIGKTIRQHINDQPEQTYDRARKEIPELDPTKRDRRGAEIDLPLAGDASWQKFSVQWGGNILIDKKQTKAKGSELARCNWNGNSLMWEIGTGEIPVYHRTLENCQMSILNNYLPVIQSKWTDSGLNYSQEAFASFFNGPLSPTDPARDEQTPAVLMVKLIVSNPSLFSTTAHIRLSGNQALNGLVFDGNYLLDQIGGKNFLRCCIKSDIKYKMELELDSMAAKRILHLQIPLDANSSGVIFLYFPFVGDLSNNDKLDALDYEIEKKRVVTYWRDLIDSHASFNVPESKLNELARAVIAHIHMSVTKDPHSGLYLVPAATLEYGVYANESIFQTMLLDRLGDFASCSDYLETFLKLQGSRSLPGLFSGDQKDVFYGVRIDSTNDLTADGYNMHHGTVLWGLAHHYLYSRDREWLLKAAPHMIRAANWIIDQRNQKKELDENGYKTGNYGLLPAGLLEDATDWKFWYATNAYAYLGLKTMAHAFEKAGLPQAEYFQKEAESYKRDIRSSVEKAVELSPVVRLRNNVYVPYVPTTPYQRFRYFGPRKAKYYDRYNLGVYPTLRRSATREVLYGPIVLIKTGLFDPDEPIADWILDDWEDNLTLSSSLNLNVHGWVDDEYWFSRGSMAFQPNLQNPIPIYLMRQEIPAAIRCLYNNLVSCLYPDVNALTEEFRQWVHGSGPFYKVPDEARFINQVYDLLIMEKNDELWLANGIPQRWLDMGQKVELNRAYTQYGQVSYSLYMGILPQTIEGNIVLPEISCSRIILFIRSPFQKPIRSVTINGKEWTEWDNDKQSIVIPQTDKNVHVIVSY